MKRNKELKTAKELTKTRKCLAIVEKQAKAIKEVSNFIEKKPSRKEFVGYIRNEIKEVLAEREDYVKYLKPRIKKLEKRLKR